MPRQTGTTGLRALRRRLLPESLQGKPLRRIQREVYQRIYRYPHRNLLAIGQPKSGSTWLYRMMGEIPGYVAHAPKGISIASRHHLRREHLTPPPAGYTVSKTHTPPTEENRAIIHEAGRPYVVLIRDPRDLVVSWAYYVALPWRDKVRYEAARSMGVPERIDYYLNEALDETLAWSLGWMRTIDPRLGLLIRYEDMLADTFAVMRQVFDHFEVGLSDERMHDIVAQHSFERATGRKPGEADSGSFNRKGVAGDWKNHFTPEQCELFKRVAGGRLIELGYANDDAWTSGGQT